MSVEITLIGLGRIGTSIGLALAAHGGDFRLTGHDKSPERARQARRLGAVGRVRLNLPASVEGADLVVLAVPLDQVRATLGFIAADLRPEAVVLDTAPARAASAGWACELLPPGRHYVGLYPALNPDSLEGPSGGQEAARPDLFAGGLVAVCPGAGTPEGAVRLAIDFVTLLGARPYFADPAEVDGIAAAAGLLPALAALALAETVSGQPGWPDIRKLAGASYAAVTRPLAQGEPAGLAEAVLQNRVNLLRLLDEYLAGLQSLRKAVADGEAGSLARRLACQADGLARWRLERARGDWRSADFPPPELPSAGDILKHQVGDWKRLLGGRPRDEG